MESLKTRRANLVGAAAFLLLGLVTFAQMAGLDESADGSDPGAAGYPRLIAAIMIVLAVMLAMQHDNGEAPPRGRDALRVAGTVGMLVLYTLVLEPLGYIFATIILLIGTMLLMGIRSALLLVVVPVGLALANFYVFYVAFGVPLPFSSLERLLS
ncbi:tripartite tricarboxylate transporter TctB family protein [Georgenia sp. MJ170]|uniref:tripartite tricarboxylate transporter TctB family protein n=1 Tax=Georgenia sunbinii TaxID=3117728 RepID=UPI002F25EB4B